MDESSILVLSSDDENNMVESPILVLTADDEIGSDIEMEEIISTPNSIMEICSSTNTSSSTDVEIIETSDSIPAKALYFYYWNSVTDQELHELHLFGQQFDEEMIQLRRRRIIVKNIYRPIFFIPYEKVIPSAVETEVYSILNKIYGMQVQKMRMKWVCKRNILLNTPHEEAHVYQVDIPAECLLAQLKYIKGKLFQQVIGYGTTLLESFLIKHAIKGPSMLKFVNYEEINEDIIWNENIENIRIIDSDKYQPTLSIASLNVTLNANKQIASVCMSSNSIKGFLLIQKPEVTIDRFLHNKTNCNNCLICDDEKELIQTIVLKMLEANPDFVFGFDLKKNLCILNERAKAQLGCDLLIGRFVCDLNKITPEMFPSLESYDFNTLFTHVFNKEFAIEHTCMACTDIQKKEIALNMVRKMSIIEFYKNIANIVGCDMEASFQSTQITRFNYLIMHECYKKDIIYPDKTKYEKVEFVGGLVFEPKIGLYRSSIILLDFSAYYPSIIIENRLSFTDSDDIVPCIVKSLQYERNQSHCKGKVAAVKEKAIKIIVNSIYGCLGCQFARFYQPILAGKITQIGREILLTSKKIVEEEFQFDVIYGDTDSLMIDVKIQNDNEAYALAGKVVESINSRFSVIKIRIDNMFSNLLLYNKKKYAGSSFSKELVMKGISRSDLPIFVNDIIRNLIQQILNPNVNQSVVLNYLKAIKTKLYKNNIPIKKMAITKKISKPLSEYDANAMVHLPHIKIALRMQSQNPLISFNVGDSVSYYICDLGKSSISDSCYLLDEVIKLNLKLDSNYYFKNVLFPNVLTIMEYVINRNELQQQLNDDVKPNNAITDDSYIFDNVYPFQFICTLCNKAIVVKSSVINKKIVLEKCYNCLNNLKTQYSSIIKTYEIYLEKLFNCCIKPDNIYMYLTYVSNLWCLGLIDWQHDDNDLKKCYNDLDLISKQFFEKYKQLLALKYSFISIYFKKI